MRTPRAVLFGPSTPDGREIAWEVLSGVVCGAAVLLVGWLVEGRADWGRAAVVAVGITVVSLALRARRRARARRAQAP